MGNGDTQFGKVKIKRGLESARTSIIPDVGELIYTTDEKRIFIGDGTTSGGTVIGGSDFSTLTGTSGADSLHKHSKLSNPSDDSEVITVDSSSDVGIGTTLPDGKVHIFRGDTSIVPDAGADELIIEGTGNTGISFLGSTSSVHSILFGDTDDVDIGSIIYTHGDSVTDDTLEFTIDTVTIMTLEKGGVGIGLSNPDIELDVNGSIGITDGVTAPAFVSGKAFIFVDSADGDLKIVFGDGTTKLIVTDT